MASPPGAPQTLATVLVMAGGLIVVAGTPALAITQFIAGLPVLVVSATDGIGQIQGWLETGPLHLTSHQVNGDAVQTWLEDHRGTVTNGALSTVGAAARPATPTLTTSSPSTQLGWFQCRTPRRRPTPSIVPAPMADAASLNGARSGEMLPGDLPEEPGLALFDGETTELFRGRWQELQLRFVDDPHAAEGQAAALVDEVVTALRDAVDRQRRALHDWQSGQGVDAHSRDTEQMRVAVRRYRDFLDHLLGV